jgi:hypothetical protein
VATADWTEKDGLLLNGRLSALGLKHAFTTRKAGSMKSPELRRETAAKLGMPAPLTLKQVHGVVIHDADPVNAGKEGDGWLISEPGIAAAVYTADCVPLFLWSDDGKAAGVFHAGWRGTEKKMAEAAVAAFQERLGVPASKLNAATGAHINACCFKVGEEFAKLFPPAVLIRRGGSLYMDLAAETRRQLVEAGVSADKIGAPAPCTACRPEDYFSYRRDKQDARLLALLTIKS